MTEDIELLRRYVETNSQEALTELVHRHIGFVYASAVRLGRGTHRADDITQRVFIDFARKAASLRNRKELVGWFYLSTHFAAVSTIRRDVRREAREQEAYMMHESTRSDSPPPDWETLRPLLDEALGELGETDRTAVLRRFFRNESFGAIAAALGLSEEAARKRVDRAVDKLQGAFARRGVTSTAGALAAVLAQQPSVAFPAGLAATVAGVAWQVAAGGGGVGLLTGFMSTSKVTVTFATVAAALAIGFALIQKQKSTVAEQSATLAEEQLALVRKDREKLQARLGDAEQRRASSDAEITRLRVENKVRSVATPLPMSSAAPMITAVPPEQQQRLQQEMKSNLIKIAAAADYFYKQKGRWPTNLAELVGPDKYIKELLPVAGEDYSHLILGDGALLQVTSTNGVSISFQP